MAMTTPDREALLAPRHPVEAQAAAGFGHLFAGVARLDVLLFGTADGGLLSRHVALEGAQATIADADAASLKAARAAAPGLPIAYKVLATADFARAFDAGTFDLLLSHLVFARVGDLAPALAQFHRVLRTDGLLAFTVPHPCFTAAPGADYFTAHARGGIDGWLAGPLHHRPIVELSDALVTAGFVPRGLSDFPGAEGRRLETACLLFECGKEKW